MTEKLRTVQDIVAGLAQGGDASALIVFHADGRRDISYRELGERCQQLAGGLAERGIGRDETVALFAPNGEAWAVGRLALVLLDVPCVPIDVDADAKRLRQLVEDSGARRLLTVPAYLPIVREALEEMEGRLELLLLEAPSGEETVEGAVGPDELVGTVPDPLPEASHDGIVSRFYTSGTTGGPKAVPLTHENIATNVRVLLDLGLIGPDYRVLLPLPMHHAYPFIVGLLLPLAAGSTVVFPSGLAGPALVQALREARVTTMVGVPRLYDALVTAIDGRLGERGPVAAGVMRGLWRLSLAVRKHLGPRLGRRLLAPLHRNLAPELELMVSGGAALDSEVWWRLEGLGWRVLTGYGLVETASVATFNPPDDARIGTVGRPPPDVELRLQPVEDMEHGEVQFRGPIVFGGYADNPEANAEAFTEDGWFRTGDLGWQDDDGHLHIVGRVKEIIVLPDGKNIAPNEVEEVYGRAPLVKEVAVLEHDGRLVAIVIPDIEAARGESGSSLFDRIRVSFGELGRELPRYMRMADFVVTREELPRNQLGKYMRHALPEIYERAERGEAPPRKALSDEDRERMESVGGRQLVAWLEERFPDHSIEPDTSLQMELGIDSLAWVDLSMDLERRVGVSLPEEAVAEAVTVRDLIDVVLHAETAEAAEGERHEARERIVANRERWLRPPGSAARVAGVVLYGLARLLVRLYFRVRARGAEHMPGEGPLILAVNHQSDLDPLVLGTALPYRVLRQSWWGADAQRVFGNRAGRALASVAHLFPVDDRAPGPSLELARKVLEDGRILIWFPEEWRSPDGELQAFRPGIGALIARTGAPVLPVRIEGAFEAMPRHARMPRPGRIDISFGRIIDAEALVPRSPADDDAAKHKAIADAVHDAVAALGDEKAEEPAQH